MVASILRTLVSKLGVLVLVAVAAVIGYGFHAWLAAGPENGYRPEMEGPAQAEAEVWICSMNITYHPYYSSDRPGRCKFCGMDLIPAPSSSGGEGGMRRFVTSAAGRALMEIEVSPVERRFVTAEVRMVGKVTYDETQVGYITAWVPGRLDRLFVDYTGVDVRAGEHMVYIYCSASDGIGHFGLGG